MYSPNLFLCVCIALSVVFTAAAVGFGSTSEGCMPVPYHQCSAFFNGDTTDEIAGSPVAPPRDAPPPLWYAKFPNARGQMMADALQEFHAFVPLLSPDDYCSYLLHSFLCLHYFSPCIPGKELPFVVPCRAVCEEAWRECLESVLLLYDIYPEHLNCTNFPIATPDTSNYIACPDPAVHMDFCMPLGEKMYTVSEAAQYVEVCIRIANTGESGALVSAVQVNVTCVDVSATGGGVDYDCPVQTLIFPVGSVRRDQRCINVSIIDDCLKEQEEIFYIWATVVSPVVGMRFGGALNSTTGQMSVRIIDDDECNMPNRYCGTQCRQRPSATKRTFANNNYTYAAHVELLGFEHSRGCTTICVRIIQCWEPKNNVCSPPNTLLTIPTCEHCPRAAITAPSDDRQEYLVAGIHRKVAGKKRMLLPGNSKKLALFVAWSDAYLNFLPAEWQPDYESPPW